MAYPSGDEKRQEFPGRPCMRGVHQNIWCLLVTYEISKCQCRLSFVFSIINELVCRMAILDDDKGGLVLVVKAIDGIF